MKLTLLNKTNHEVPKSLFTPILKRLPEVEPGLPHTELELLLTDNAEIQILNRDYRGKDKATDVLSFSLDDDTTLGQLVISLERTEEQAKEVGNSFEEELKFLFAHGLIHLCGYDHETPEEEAVMLPKVYRVLGRINSGALERT